MHFQNIHVNQFNKRSRYFKNLAILEILLCILGLEHVLRRQADLKIQRGDQLVPCQHSISISAWKFAAQCTCIGTGWLGGVMEKGE